MTQERKTVAAITASMMLAVVVLTTLVFTTDETSGRTQSDQLPTSPRSVFYSTDGDETGGD